MILIADDFDSEIVLLKSILNELGFVDLLIANDGKQAIELLETNEVKVVITDYNMPYKNGADVIKVAQSQGIRQILLRSSHSKRTLIEKLQENLIDPNSIEIVCKRDFDSTELKMFLKSFLIFA